MKKSTGVMFHGGSNYLLTYGNDYQRKQEQVPSSSYKERPRDSTCSKTNTQTKNCEINYIAKENNSPCEILGVFIYT